MSLNIFGLSIPLYGIMITIGIVIAMAIAIWLGKKRGFKSDDYFTLALYVIPLAVLGARTYFAIFSGANFTFLEFFEIWNGGLAILGAVIGGAIGVLLYSLIHKKNFFKLADTIAPALLVGQAIGRIGCYFAGCCHGVEITNSALHFFPAGIVIDETWHYATMFWECAWCLLAFAALLLIFKRFKQTGVALSCYCILYGIGRAIIETFRGDSLYLFGSGLKVSQLLSILLIIAGIIALIIIYTKSRKQPSEKDNNS